MNQRFWPVLICVVIASSTLLSAQSYYTLRPNDPLASYLTKDQFDVHADGIADDSPPDETKFLLPVGLHNELSVLNDMLAQRGYNYQRAGLHLRPRWKTNWSFRNSGTPRQHGLRRPGSFHTIHWGEEFAIRNPNSLPGKELITNYVTSFHSDGKGTSSTRAA